MQPETLITLLLTLAWLLPLGSFAIIVFAGPRLGRGGVGAGYLATGAILASCVLSLAATVSWLTLNPLSAKSHGAAHESYMEAAGSTLENNEAKTHAAEHDKKQVVPIADDWYALGTFGSLSITIGYYIDSLTIVMFAMVTLVASCIHIYSFGYMHEELEPVYDSLARLADGSPLERRGRFHRFYQYLSLFCFSMLGLVIAGNIAMVFVFWELVGICSYLLIGFYFERKSASNAANKAFIVNRVGDFGMLVGLMVIWATLGTFSFGGIFAQVRPGPDHALVVPDGMVQFDSRGEIAAIAHTADSPQAARDEIARMTPRWRDEGRGYWLLVLAGLGIFCGCVGKSAQFPLHVWLPDAMEGPTPVSALIHAATMVAAGVYLVGRFYPFFAPEVLITIGYVGCFTLFMASTIAVTATDIKRVLAYSTVSQLGYMTLSLGIGGWLAGLFHLITHACFKSLLFLCSGSVIHACHTNEMPEMGGLRKKMPWTAGTMLVGCLAISGAGIPLLFGLSGYHSKDSILAQAFLFRSQNPLHGGLFFWAAAVGATITAAYMFRLWFLTFSGEPRNRHVADHAHESPWSMVGPLAALAVLAVVAGWNFPLTGIGVQPLLEQARPLGTALGIDSATVHIPAESLSHAESVHVPVSLIAFAMAAAGFIVAVVFYGKRYMNPADVRRTFSSLYTFLLNKWYFDELYQVIFIRPVLWLSRLAAGFDRRVIDWIVDGMARLAKVISLIDEFIDRRIVDGLVNAVARGAYAAGLRLRAVQTGSISQYVMFIVIGVVLLFIIAGIYWDIAMAGM